MSMGTRPLTVFPAQARLNGHAWARAKVRTNADHTRIQVWVESTGYPKSPVCVVDSFIVATLEGYDQYAPLSQRYAKWALANGTDNHDLLEIQAAGGCGCGSPLQQLPQWQPMLTTQPAMAIPKVTKVM